VEYSNFGAAKISLPIGVSCGNIVDELKISKIIVVIVA
jgi:hypothetical protein